MRSSQSVYMFLVVSLTTHAWQDTMKTDNTVPISEDVTLTCTTHGCVNGTPGRCLFENTCRGKCDQVGVSHTRYCQCDRLCWLYGDCCQDYYTSCLGLGTAEPDEFILIAVLAGLTSYYEALRFYEALTWRRISSCHRVNGRYIQVVRVCGKEREVRDRFRRVQQKLYQEANSSSAFVGVTMQNVIDNCENLNLNDESPTLPVSLSKGYVVHFYNVFCALCNGLDPYKVEVWNISKADTENLNKTVIKYGQLIYQKEHSAISPSTNSGWRWCLKGQDDTVNGGENSFKLYSGEMAEARSNNTTVGNKTSTAASLCLSTDPSQLRVCQMYQRPYVVLAKGVILKNQHCALCDGTSSVASCASQNCSCPEENASNFVQFFKETDNGIAFPNFKQLFYFREAVVGTSSKVSEETKQCPKNQVFSPFHDHCVDIQCPPGTTAGGGLCLGVTPCDRNVDDCADNVVDEITEESMPFPLGSKIVTVTFTLQNVAARLKPEAPEQEKNAVHLMETVPRTHSRATESGETGTVRVDLENAFDSPSSLTLQNITSIWVPQMSAMGKLRSGTMASNLLNEMRKIVADSTQMKDVRYSLNQLASCPLDSNRRPEICVAMVFGFNCTSLSSRIMSLVEKELVPLAMIAAHKNNFIVSGVSAANADLSEDGGRSLGTMKDHVCPDGRRAEIRTVNVNVNENGTYVIKTNDSLAYPISHFGFSMNITVDEVAEESRFSDTADIAVCLSNMSMWNCTAVFYNRSSIVLYQSRLIITRHASVLLAYLQTPVESNNTVLPNILNQFAADYNVSDVEIHEQGSYVLNNYGAYVCSNYSRLYTFTHATGAPYRFLPTSLWEQIATGISLAVSVASLLTVLVVYGLVPELRNTPGKIVMSLSGTLLAAQVMFLCSLYPRGLFCEVYAAVQHALWLSASAWLAVMAVHLTCSLYRQAKMASGSRFYIFASLCWGLPCFFSGGCLTLDKTGLAEIEYGSEGVCWFGNLEAMSLFFGLPLFLLVAVTLVSAAFIVAAIKRSSDFVNKVTRDPNRALSQLLLCFNLSLLMGLGWVVYFIAILVDTWALWVLFILSYGSQGFFVFICYVARGSVRRKLVKRWGQRNTSTSSKDAATKVYTESVKAASQ